jgi:hypothetical protein
MAKFKVIDEEIIDGYIANLQNGLDSLKTRGLDEAGLQTSTLVLQTGIAIYETIKAKFRDLDDHLGNLPLNDISRQYGPDMFMLKDPGIKVFGDDSTEYNNHLQQKIAFNSSLKIIDTRDLEQNIEEITKQMVPIANNYLNITTEDKIMFAKHWALFEALLQVKNILLTPLVSHLEDAFKAGVSSICIDGYHTRMYQYLQKMGYENAA